MGEEMRILSIRPCGTSAVLLHAVKSYDMGPSRFFPIREEGVLRIFIALKIHLFGRVRTRKIWVQWQAH
jgi:hypothetical protein